MEHTKLCNGLSLPMLGLGTYSVHSESLLSKSLNLGYSLFDSAHKYRNHEDIALCLKHVEINPIVISKVPSEIYNGRKRYLYLNKRSVAQCYAKSVRELKGAGPQIYLLHSLFRNYEQAYSELVELYDSGKISAFGVCNCDTISALKTLKASSGSYPLINQIEVHPYNTKEELMAFCKDNGIQVMARSPFAHGEILPELNAELADICHTYNKTTAQVVLRWIIQQGVIAIPRANNMLHLAENMDVFDFELSNEHMRRISNLNINKSFGCISSKKT